MEDVLLCEIQCIIILNQHMNRIYSNKVDYNNNNFIFFAREELLVVVLLS